jgi:Kef-type K+ transport system membrane component KefB
VLKKDTSRLAVGIGMIPRGEVGLIFASLGLARKVISPGEYAGIIAIIIATTFITPPLLKMAFKLIRKAKFS